MFASASRSSPTAVEAAAALSCVRVEGGYGIGVAQDGGSTRLVSLEERGGWRLRFPHIEAGTPIEAVSINTGGGIVGGDRIGCDVTVESGHLRLASQAAERIYRSLGPAAEVSTRLRAGPGSVLEWLPQETILFSGARLARRLDVAITASSRLLMVEMIVLGRTASGETVRDGALNDQWRVRRDGRLIFAEAFRIDGDIAATMERPSIGGGARASALLLHAAPDADHHLDRVREVLANSSCDSGASAWNGLLAVRAVARDTAELRRLVCASATAISGRPMPRVWSL